MARNGKDPKDILFEHPRGGRVPWGQVEKHYIPDPNADVVLVSTMLRNIPDGQQAALQRWADIHVSHLPVHDTYGAICALLAVAVDEGHGATIHEVALKVTAGKNAENILLLQAAA